MLHLSFIHLYILLNLVLDIQCFMFIPFLEHFLQVLCFLTIAHLIRKLFQQSHTQFQYEAFGSHSIGLDLETTTKVQNLFHNKSNFSILIFIVRV